jgi:hypothetical protein
MKISLCAAVVTSAAVSALLSCSGEVVVLGGLGPADASAKASAPPPSLDSGSESLLPEAAGAGEGSSSDAGPPPVGTEAGPPAATARASGVVKVAAVWANPTAIAVDRTSVYCNNSNGLGEVLKVSTEGGDPVQLAVGPVDALAVDSTSVYWIGGGNVMKVPVDGGDVTTLASGQAAVAIAVDAHDVYWTNGWSGASQASGSIVKAAIDGGGSITLASGLVDPKGLAIDGSSAYWLEGVAPGDASFGPTLAYRSVPLDGGAPLTLATGGGLSFYGGAGWVPLINGAVAASAGTLYAIDSNGLSATAVDGGPPVVFAPGGNPYLAVDGAKAFWTVTASVVGVSIEGGAPFLVADHQIAPAAVAVDDKNVYWTTSYDANGQGAIMKAPK